MVTWEKLQRTVWCRCGAPPFDLLIVRMERHQSLLLVSTPIASHILSVPSRSPSATLSAAVVDITGFDSDLPTISAANFVERTRPNEAKPSIYDGASIYRKGWGTRWHRVLQYQLSGPHCIQRSYDRYKWTWVPRSDTSEVISDALLSSRNSPRKSKRV